MSTEVKKFVEYGGADSEVASVTAAVTLAAETAAPVSDKQGLDKSDIKDSRKHVLLFLKSLEIGYFNA